MNGLACNLKVVMLLSCLQSTELHQPLLMRTSVDFCVCLRLGCVSSLAPHMDDLHVTWCICVGSSTSFLETSKALEGSWMNLSQARTRCPGRAVLWESWRLCYHSGSLIPILFSGLITSSVFVSVLPHVCAVVGELSFLPVLIKVTETAIS